MNVCLVGRYFGLQGGGIGRVSMEVRNGLLQQGYSVRTISTQGRSLYSYFLYTLCGIPFSLPRKDMDVYHALTPMEAIWLPKRKSVVTFHDLFQFSAPDKLGAGMGDNKWKVGIGSRYFEIASKIASRCAKVVAVSEQTKRDLMKYLEVEERKIEVIRSGIPAQLEPLARGSNGMFVVGYLGQLDRRKRVHLLIDAFKRSKLDILVISGLGLERDTLVKQAFGDNRIRFYGLMPNGGLKDFYNSLDLFVFPTWIEGYGLPPVEAMACKKPVMVLQDAIIPEEVKSRCIVVDNLEVLSDKAQLDKLIKGVDIEGNYLWAKGHSWDKCVEEYVKLYREVIL